MNNTAKFFFKNRPDIIWNNAIDYLQDSGVNMEMYALIHGDNPVKSSDHTIISIPGEYHEHCDHQIDNLAINQNLIDFLKSRNIGYTRDGVIMQFHFIRFENEIMKCFADSQQVKFAAELFAQKLTEFGVTNATVGFEK